MEKTVFTNIYNEETPEEAAKRIMTNEKVQFKYSGVKLETMNNRPVIIKYTGKYFDGDPEISITFHI